MLLLADADTDGVVFFLVFICSQPRKNNLSVALVFRSYDSRRSVIKYTM